MEAEEQDQRPGDGRKQILVLLQETAHGAGGCPEADKNDREADNEGKCGSEDSAFGLLALAELLDADPGKHGDVAGNEREDAGREKREQPCDKGEG